MSAITLPPITPVPTEELLELLVEANVTDPARWPEGAKHGARLLARIQQIEQDCLAEHGSWDWELLPADLQIEYDSACSELNQLRSNGNERPFADVMKELGIEP